MTLNMQTIASFIILSVLLLFFCSPNNYQIHVGESYIKDTKTGSFSGQSQIQNMSENLDFETIGIYSNKNLFLDKYPVLRTYQPKHGLTFTPIAKKVNCKNGSLVKIKGKICTSSIQYAYIKKTYSYQLLEPSTVEIVTDTWEILHHVTREYQKIMEKLEQQIRIDDSKLKLSTTPDWFIWYEQSNNCYLFTSFQYDLMFAANVEFVVDSKSEKIKTVYAKQWFKGEL